MNRVDPHGLFPEQMIWKNIPFVEFNAVEPSSYPLVRDRWGFYALLLDAQEFDYMNSGYLDLVQFPHPVISYSKTERIWTKDCETIMIGSKTVEQYYRDEVRRQRSLGVRWRDTSARYYQLFSFAKSDRSYVDGSRWIDYPDYHGVSLGLGTVELNLIIDANGRFHLSGSGGGPGKAFGLGYTESYLCKIGTCLMDRSSIDDVMDAIDGICGTGGIIFIKGRAISLCPSSNLLDLGSYTGVWTYYLGAEVGAAAGASLTIPLPFQDANFGWREAIDDQLNGITLADVLSR